MSFSKVPFTTEMNPRSPFDDTAAATGNALKAVDEGFKRYCLEGIYAEYITKDSKVHRDDTSAYKKGHVLLDVDTLKAILLDGGLQLGHSTTPAETARGADIAVRFFQSMKGIDTAKLVRAVQVGLPSFRRGRLSLRGSPQDKSGRTTLFPPTGIEA